MSGFFGTEPADHLATWIAAIATVAVLGGMLGERRVFAWTQHLLAGLTTGFLGLLAISEVIVPRLIEPIVLACSDRLDAAARRRVRGALSLVMGVEAVVSLRDIAGESTDGAIQISRWAAETLMRAALSSDAVSGSSRRRRR